MAAEWNFRCWACEGSATNEVSVSTDPGFEVVVSEESVATDVSNIELSSYHSNNDQVEFVEVEGVIQNSP